MKKNKYTKLIGSILVLAIGGATFVSIAKENVSVSRQSPTAIMAQQIAKSLLVINEVSIPQEEYEMFLQDQKALTVNYFTQTYGAEYDAEFWTTKYGEEIPIEVAKGVALEKLVRMKVEQQVAKELGLIGDTHFNTLIEEMDKNKSMYGAENMDLFQRYSVFHSKLVLDAKNQFKINYKEIDEKILKAKYEEVKETLFNVPDDLKVMELAIEIIEENDTESVLNAILADVGEEITVDDLISKYQGKALIVPKEKNYGVYEGKDSNLSEQDLMLKEMAYTLENGEVTMMMPSEEECYILICVERQTNGIASFDEVKSIVEDMVKEEAYKAYIDGLIDKAKIDKDHQTYNAVMMQ